MPAAVMEFLDKVLGPVEVVADYSWDHHASSVQRLRDTAGNSWILKRHREIERYRNESRAYRKWVPDLGALAPRLQAADDDLRALVLTALPGDSALRPDHAAAGLQPGIQWQAGRALRILHDSELFQEDLDLTDRKHAEFERYAADDLLPATVADAVRDELRAFDSSGPAESVPCHRDYNLRNWLVAEGRLRVIDFEWVRPDLWLSDLTRLELGCWHDHPALREAFLDGYGRTLDESDRALLRSCCLLNTVFLIDRAREYGLSEFEQHNRNVLHRLTAG